MEHAHLLFFEILSFLIEVKCTVICEEILAATILEALELYPDAEGVSYSFLIDLDKIYLELIEFVKFRKFRF